MLIVPEEPGEEPERDSPPFIVYDEFPARYPSVSCSPAALTCVSPAGGILLDHGSAVLEDFSERGTAFISRVSPQGFTPIIRVHSRSFAAPNQIRQISNSRS